MLGTVRVNPIVRHFDDCGVSTDMPFLHGACRCGQAGTAAVFGGMAIQRLIDGVSRPGCAKRRVVIRLALVFLCWYSVSVMCQTESSRSLRDSRPWWLAGGAADPETKALPVLRGIKAWQVPNSSGRVAPKLARLAQPRSIEFQGKLDVPAKLVKSSDLLVEPIQRGVYTDPHGHLSRLDSHEYQLCVKLGETSLARQRFFLGVVTPQVENYSIHVPLAEYGGELSGLHPVLLPDGPWLVGVRVIPVDLPNSCGGNAVPDVEEPSCIAMRVPKRRVWRGPHVGLLHCPGGGTIGVGRHQHSDVHALLWVRPILAPSVGYATFLVLYLYSSSCVQVHTLLWWCLPRGVASFVLPTSAS